jgi:serine/threonine protein kinase
MTAASHDSVDLDFGPGGMNAIADPHIPGYRVEGLIGSGGMASVYLAIQESLQRPVALKVLDDPESPEYQERFLNEGRIIASLTHSNIITVHDIGIANGHLYISMEYVEGGDLRRRIRDGMTPPEAFEIIEHIGGALRLAHGRGVIHRDVKPANILFRLDGTILLADFGVAKDHQRDSELTLDGSVLGSPYYLSPELTRAQEIDGRVDIYSLGIILFEMLTGEKPFKGESALDTVFKHINDPVPTLPEELVRLQYIIDKMLAKEPEDRFADVDDMLETVREATARGFDEIADRMVHGTETVMLEATWIDHNVKGRKRKRGRKLARIAGLAAGLCMLALGGALYFGVDQGPSEPSVATKPADSSRGSASSSSVDRAGMVTHVASIDPVRVADTPSGAAPAPAGTKPRAQTTDAARSKTKASGPSSSEPSPARTALASATPPKKSTSKPKNGTSKSSKSKSSTTKSSTSKSSTPKTSKPKSKKVAKRKVKKTTSSPPAPRAKTAREIEVEHLSAMARKRLRQGRLHKPLGDNATFYRDQLVKLDPHSPATERLSDRIAAS